MQEDLLQVRFQERELVDADVLLAERGQQSFEVGISFEPEHERAPSRLVTRGCHDAGMRSAAMRTVSPATRASRFLVVSSATTRPAFSIAMRPHSASASSR